MYIYFIKTFEDDIYKLQLFGIYRYSITSTKRSHTVECCAEFVKYSLDHDKQERPRVEYLKHFLCHSQIV